MSPKCFIDYLDENGIRVEGTIAWPASAAVQVAEDMRREHPDWHVWIEPMEGTP